jgi:ribonuclease I
LKNKIGPENCNASVPFDFNKIKWLLPILLEYWPNLYTDTPLASFWQHEWEKHGKFFFFQFKKYILKF